VQPERRTPTLLAVTHFAVGLIPEQRCRRQVTRLNMDPGDHKAVTQKLRSVPNLTHVLFLGRASGSAADRDLAADLEGFRSLVAAARAAGCPLQMTQFMTAEDSAKGARRWNIAWRFGQGHMSAGATNNMLMPGSRLSGRLHPSDCKECLVAACSTILVCA